MKPTLLPPPVDDHGDVLAALGIDPKADNVPMALAAIRSGAVPATFTASKAATR